MAPAAGRESRVNFERGLEETINMTIGISPVCRQILMGYPSLYTCQYRRNGGGDGDGGSRSFIVML